MLLQAAMRVDLEAVEPEKEILWIVVIVNIERRKPLLSQERNLSVCEIVQEGFVQQTM